MRVGSLFCFRQLAAEYTGSFLPDGPSGAWKRHAEPWFFASSAARYYSGSFMHGE
jgi:hypothetical protein